MIFSENRLRHPDQVRGNFGIMLQYGDFEVPGGVPEKVAEELQNSKTAPDL